MKAVRRADGPTPPTDDIIEAGEALKRAHAKTVLTPWSAQGALDPPLIVRGEGSYLIDADGKRYVDLSAGLVAINLGHGHRKVVAAIARQAERLCYATPAYFNDTRARAATRLVALAPWPEGARAFFTVGGGEANEDAVKMARMITGRAKVLAGYRSFHGSAPGAGALTGEARRWWIEPGMPGVVHFFAPFPYRSPFGADSIERELELALEHLELVLLYEDPQRVAALIIEPVVGSNGVIVYPEGYLAGVRKVCDRHGILLIFDEVMTGFGRVGGAFAAHKFGVTPDMITFAKGVASAYVPLGGALVRERLAKHFDTNVLMCGHTYSGHPLAMAAAEAALAAYEEEAIFDRVPQLETWIRDGLEQLRARHPVVGDVRGVGAMFGLELVRDRKTKEPFVPWHGSQNAPMTSFLGDLRKRGVYAFARFNVVLVTPPLTIEKRDLDVAFEALDGALGAIA